jgi:hypothetical protein
VEDATLESVGSGPRWYGFPAATAAARGRTADADADADADAETMLNTTVTAVAAATTPLMSHSRLRRLDPARCRSTVSEI